MIQEKRHQIKSSKDYITDILEIASNCRIEPRQIVIFPGKGQWIIEITTTNNRWNVLAARLVNKGLHKEADVCL